MRVQVLALDYDGTIATNGALDPGVREAIADARRHSITVVLVTGRVLADLERLLGDLGVFDAIVAENGAVLHFPESGRSLTLAPAPPPVFLEELRRRELPFLAGDCVVELEATRARDVLAVVQDTQLPLVLLFNRGRLMVLPQAVSKATGLREALRALRLSAHNAVGIGDAENDHALLSFCELGVAVAWGSPALRAAADEVLAGDGPPAVAPFIGELLAQERIPPSRLRRRRIHLGVREGGGPLGLAASEHNVLIAGDTQSGKSWVAGVLCEQLVLAHYCVCVIDPEGEYASLQTLPAVVVFHTDPPPSLGDLERTLRYPDVSVVLDLSAMSLAAKCAYAREVLAHLRNLRRRTGLPHRIVVDEAHYFLREGSVAELLDLELGGYTLVTWHASQLHAEVLSAADAILVTRVSDRDEARALHALRGGAHDADRWSALIGDLDLEHAVLLPGAEEAGTELVRFRVSARLTSHVRHLQKYLNRRAPAGCAFAIQADGAPGGEARSLGELLSLLSAAPDIQGHLRRRDFSRWIRDVFDDQVLANRVRLLEERSEKGEVEQPHLALISMIRERFGGGANPARPKEEPRAELGCRTP